MRIRVSDEKSTSTFGHMIFHEQQKGYVFPLVFDNSSNRKNSTVTYRIDKEIYVPEGISVGVFNPARGTLEKASSVSAVEIAAGQKEHRWLIAGDSSFIASWVGEFKLFDFALKKLYPNPCKSNIMIRFTIPFTGISEVRVAIFDQLGRKIFYREVNRALRPGLNSLQWNPEKDQSLAAGSYILQLTAIDSKGRKAGVAQSRIMYMP